MSESRFLDIQAQENGSQGNSIASLDLLKEQNRHQKALQAEQHAHEKEIQKEQHEHESAMLNKKMGWLGSFFGSEENSSKNITAFICCLLLVFALGVSIGAYFCKNDTSFAKWLWGAILPIVSLSLGYLFGKK